ncbi:MAG: hypothetical protein EBV00_06950, partial [Burkholderiaceae bacterium]|nr:hypothetical protein [Burkholderiaceae bacterium]
MGKGLNIDSVAEAISYAQKMGFLCDKTQLSFILEKLIRKGKGKHMIIAYLSRYHFDRETVEESLRSLCFNPKEEIERLVEKKIGNSPLDDPKKKAKIILFLQRKGFAFEEIGLVRGTDQYHPRERILGSINSFSNELHAQMICHIFDILA